MRRLWFAVGVACLVLVCFGVWLFVVERGRGPEEAVPNVPAEGAGGVANGVVARIKVVGLDGKPLPGMIPIATESPNAFDEPVSRGAPTDSQGTSRLALDPNRWLYVRAWDPDLRFFANNYFDVPSGQAEIKEELVVVMVEGATLRATLYAPDGSPVAEENVGLMMFHPEKGPWWPAEADTDLNGNVAFSRVPAGQFLLALKTAKSGKIDLPAVFLPPAGETNLGRVQLLPE